MVTQKRKKFLTLGVDIGGTKINVGLVDATGRLLAVHRSQFHASKEPEKVIADVVDGVEVCLSKTGQEAKALGVGVAAQVDRKGLVRGSQNLGWRNVPLKKMLEKKLELPVTVINDVNAATVGEWQFGSGKGVKDLAVLFLGTGVGGGIITGGKLLSGCNNSGGELGHITIVSNGRKCHCPGTGCLEAYVGGWAIAERAQETIRTLSIEGKRLLTMAGRIQQVTAVTVSQAYREGDLLARLVVEETGRYLAAGVVSIVNAFNPCLVVLGGGVIEGIPNLIPMVDDIVRNSALETNVEKLKIIKAALGGNAGVIGAAALARELLE
ncbi:MAG: ROK family protein [Candidatus Bathyarchaeum sp.]|nr:MAG: ROK family protein [Candidatus Bathyarchaeum sp.]